MLKFLSSSEKKAKEYLKLAKVEGVALSWKDFEFCQEGETLRESVLKKVAEASSRESPPFFVEDTGFFVEDLGGLPGALANRLFPVMRKILPKFVGSPAEFRAVIALYTGEGVRLFEGKVRGRIVVGNPQPGSFLAYDSFFAPDGSQRSFAEDPETKNRVSHRAKAFGEMVKWLRSRKYF